MKITYSGNKIFEINNFGYLQKLINTEMFKTRNNIYTPRCTSVQSSKNKHHQQTFKSKFRLFLKIWNFYQI